MPRDYPLLGTTPDGQPFPASASIRGRAGQVRRRTVCGMLTGVGLGQATRVAEDRDYRGRGDHASLDAI